LDYVVGMSGSPWDLFDHVASGVAVTTSDGTLEFCNTALLQLLAQSADALRGLSIFQLLDGGGGGELELLQRTALSVNTELRAQVRSSGGRFVAAAVLRRLPRPGGDRVVWSFVDARCNEPVPELALWGTEIGDGSQFAGEVLSVEIDLSGEKWILVVVQDVSERKQLESEIIEIANRERRRLGADLHDGLGQELTGISLMLRSFSKRAGLAAFETAPELDEIITLVNHAIQSARKMALGISPVTLERGGLLPALQTLVGWSRKGYNIDVRLRLSIRDRRRHDGKTIVERRNPGAQRLPAGGRRAAISAPALMQLGRVVENQPQGASNAAMHARDAMTDLHS
jgi:signal transduction histidine kinase